MTWHTARTMKIPNPLEEEETVTALIEQPTELIQSLVISELMKIKGSFKDLCISIVTVLWWWKYPHWVNIPILSPYYPMLLCYLVCDNVWYGYGSNIEEISPCFTVPLEATQATHIWTIGPLERCAVVPRVEDTYAPIRTGGIDMCLGRDALLVHCLRF